MPTRAELLLALVALATACPGGGGGGGGRLEICATEADEADAVAFVPAFGGLGFDSPVALVQHPDDPDRFYVVELGGTIRTFLASDPGTLSEAVDVNDHVTLFTQGEGGLFSLAFAPDFDANGEVYLSYTEGTAGDFASVLARYESSDGGTTFDPVAPDPVVLALDQPASNHNGGDLDFGPDGFLYWAVGDGGGANDPFENGQDVTSLLGTILRLDVSSTPYAVPPDNPFVGSAGADEIFAFGLRNPWRMSFDRMTDALWAADVGQGDQEEVDIIVAGGNYGWDCYEGFEENEIDASCRPAPIDPELAHAQPYFQSITGGHVYRGAALPALEGGYVYGDFVEGRICAYFETGPRRVVSLDPPDGLAVVSFAEDAAGELYVVDFGGAIYAIEPAPRAATGTRRAAGRL